MPRCVSGRVLQVGISTEAEKEPRRFKVFFRDRYVQGCVATLVARVDITAIGSDRDD